MKIFLHYLQLIIAINSRSLFYKEQQAFSNLRIFIFEKLYCLIKVQLTFNNFAKFEKSPTPVFDPSIL